MKAILTLTIVLAISTISHAQMSETWAMRYNGPGSGVDKSYAVAVDASGNVYVTGSSITAGFGSEDYTTIKYNSAGTQVWAKRYNGTGGGSDYAYAITTDASSNIYVTGGSWSTGSGFDYITIKYNSSGDSLWVARYNGPRNGGDKAYSITVDASGNVYVTGESEGLTSTHGIYEDYATVKYSSAGVQLWAARYYGPVNDYDCARSVAVDASGNVYVTGTSDGGSGGSGMPYFDYATLKYNSAGIVQWIMRYNGPGSSDDDAKQVKVDTYGNVYVTGKSYGTAANTDYATIKYNSAGTLQWVSRYNGLGASTDEANALVVDRFGNVYVTGKSYSGTSANYDYATVKYSSTGVQTWVQTYNGPSSGIDNANALTLDTAGNVYVTGGSTAPTTALDFATIKYNTSGVQQWVMRYTNGGSAGSSDEPASIFVDIAGNVYVTGMSALDYATVKYAPTPTGIEPNSSITATDFSLEQNYPNPFNPSTNIRYNILNSTNVKLSVYDINGREVAVLVDEAQQKGSYEITFNAAKLSSGVYFYKLVTNEFSDVKRMSLVK